MAGGPSLDWRAPCRAQLLSRESDVEDGARKLGAALEDGRGPLGGPCGLRAKEKTDLERMEAATMGATKTDPSLDCGAREAAGAGSFWTGRVGSSTMETWKSHQGEGVGAVAPGVGNTEGS